MMIFEEIKIIFYLNFCEQKTSSNLKNSKELKMI